MRGTRIDHVRYNHSCLSIKRNVFLSFQEVAVSLGKNDVRIYQKVAGKWKMIHTLTEHLSRVLAIDWAPKTNQIVSASAVRRKMFDEKVSSSMILFFVFRIITRTFGHAKMTFGNRKWLNYNERVEPFVVQNGHQTVEIKRRFFFVS